MQSRTLSLELYIYTRTLSLEVHMYIYIVQDFVLGVMYVYTYIYRPGPCPWSYLCVYSPGLCPWSYVYTYRVIYIYIQTRTLSLELHMYVYIYSPGLCPWSCVYIYIHRVFGVIQICVAQFPKITHLPKIKKQIAALGNVLWELFICCVLVAFCLLLHTIK